MANLTGRMFNPSNLKICLHQLFTSTQSTCSPRLSLFHGDFLRRVCHGSWKYSPLISRPIDRNQCQQLSSSNLGSVKYCSTSNQGKHSEHKHKKPPDLDESKPSESSEPVIESILSKPDPELVRYVDDLINYVGKPQRRALTIFKVIVTLLAGLYFGAFLAKLGANLLEEYEIFVRGDDDDD